MIISLGDDVFVHLSEIGDVVLTTGDDRFITLEPRVAVKLAEFISAAEKSRWQSDDMLAAVRSKFKQETKTV